MAGCDMGFHKTILASERSKVVQRQSTSAMQHSGTTGRVHDDPSAASNDDTRTADCVGAPAAATGILLGAGTGSAFAMIAVAFGVCTFVDISTAALGGAFVGM